MTGIIGNVTVSGRTFAFGEVQNGKNRAIKIAETGVAGSAHEYSLKWKNDKGTPSNIHESGVYSGSEKDFYKKLATGVANKVVTQRKWPASRWEFTYEKTQFILTLE